MWFVRLLTSLLQLSTVEGFRKRWLIQTNSIWSILALIWPSQQNQITEMFLINHQIKALLSYISRSFEVIKNTLVTPFLNGCQIGQQHFICRIIEILLKYFLDNLQRTNGRGRNEEKNKKAVRARDKGKLWIMHVIKGSSFTQLCKIEIKMLHSSFVIFNAKLVIIRHPLTVKSIHYINMWSVAFDTCHLCHLLILYARPMLIAKALLRFSKLDHSFAPRVKLLSWEVLACWWVPET